ncbi:kinase-like domain-containing protein [Mycena latifolia]|nr:kinase-like domain-containing protein [Mycena latifolia]
MDAALGITGAIPVPGLSSAFTLLHFIVCGVPEVQASKRQIKALASTTGQLLVTLNAEFTAKRLVEENCTKPLEDLRNFYRRIGMIINEFQSMLKQDETARIEDAESLAARLDSLEKNQLDLREALDVNQNNLIAMMVSIQRRLETQPTITHNPEQQFYAHALEYLSATSGKRVEAEDWMIPAFEVDYGEEIGSGGFGTVYRGTWNRTEVAIKSVHNFGGLKPNVSLLRKEIDVWLNLRHPNILQFLGANTLDDKPFIMMPYIPYNARQFLLRHASFDPIYILRDISLGLEYLHSRKICHGDLKGINVLVDDLGRALLCDFGLSRIKADITSRTTQVGTITSGSRNWMAPEMFAGSPARLPSDIYAFGMTVYERSSEWLIDKSFAQLYTDEIPLSSVAFNDFVEVVLRMGVRPERPDVQECPRLTDALWELAQSCWTKDPKVRPTARQVHDIVAHLIKDMTRRTQQTRSFSMPDVAPNTAGHLRESSSPANGARPPRLPHSRSATEGHSRSAQRDASARGISATGLIIDQDTLEAFVSMSKDARACRRLGRFSEAEQLAVELVDKQTQILGADHPDTLRSVFTLAATYADTGEYRKAQELTVAVMQRRARVLGSDHPDTLRCMSSLAVVYYRMGELQEAEKLAAMVLEKRTRILGREHLETLVSMHDLSVTYHGLGRLQEAAQLQEQVRDARSRVLGVEHPETLRCMYSLAGTYHKLGHFQAAEDLARDVVQHRGKTLGREHPDTLYCMFGLAGTYHKLGKLAEAEELAAEVLQVRTKVLGPDHPETLLTMHNLAVINYAARKLDDTIQLAMDVIDRENEVLGNDHPYTRRSSMLLERVFQALG